MTPQDTQKMKDALKHLLEGGIDERLMIDAIAAMIAGLIETHPDKTALHESFSRNFAAMGGPGRAVTAMAKGNSGAAGLFAGWSAAIGRELP